MSNIKSRFDAKKALEAILYIAKRTHEQPTYMRVVKLLYLADKTSLEQFGRFISGDTYYAMEHGPVPTNLYNILKERDTQDKGFEIVAQNYPTIKVYRDADIDYLSESDTDCLDKTLSAYDQYPTWHLRSITHDEAWKQTWEENGQVGSHEIPLYKIAQLLENGDELINHLENLNS